MSTFAATQPSPFERIRSTASMGTKFFVLFALAVLMSIPAFFVDSLADQRAAQRGAVVTYDAAGQEHAPATVFGVHLADSYRSIHRSLKYVTLFLGLVFLTYFIFEVTNGKRVHAGQYALVGVAQIIFYLLLLSLAEHLGFDFAFLIAGSATVLLFSVNTLWLFNSRALGVRAVAVFTALYAFIYVLLRLQDYALLVGACASFLAVALTMYFTRSVDWYSRPGAPLPAGGAPTRESWLD